MSERVPYQRRQVLESLNAWPGGPRMMDCLQCEHPFLSSSKSDRKCRRCNGMEDVQQKRSAKYAEKKRRR